MTGMMYMFWAPFVIPPVMVVVVLFVLCNVIVGVLTSSLAVAVLWMKAVPFAMKASPVVMEAIQDASMDVVHALLDYLGSWLISTPSPREDHRPLDATLHEHAEILDQSSHEPYDSYNITSSNAPYSQSRADGTLAGLTGTILQTDFESVGGWKVSQHQDHDLDGSDQTTSLPGRGHRRTQTSGSLRMSRPSSPEQPRTSSEGRTSLSNKKRRLSEGSNAEGYLSMATRTGDAEPNISKHSRSGSSSTSSSTSVRGLMRYNVP